MQLDDLKQRERDVLQHMAENLTNAQIAIALSIGVETVRTYAKRIYQKLDVSDRKEAVQKAKHLGLLKDNSDSNTITQPKHNLPNTLTSFIGRKHQIEDLTNLLEKQRLLTLTGPGGTGKTRLAIRIAEKQLGRFKDGVYFVDLAPLNDSDAVPKAIATTLGIIENSEESIPDILKQVIESRHILIVIDNFEHVIEGAPIVSELLKSTTNLKIIVTSREVLHLSGEQEYRVPPLNLYDSNGDNIPEAVTLFLQRAQLVNPHLSLEENNRENIIDICNQVDGLPLAIELAAAQCQMLPPHALLNRLKKQLLHLSSGVRDVPERQQTLQSTIEWSYNLLDEAEKILFMRLSVFRGGRSLSAIEAVCGQDLSIDGYDGMRSLVQKSLVQQVEDELGESRFIMLETLQEYAGQELEACNEASIMRRNHATYFMESAEQGAPELRRANQQWWYKKLDIEQNNLRHAMTWALSGEDVEIGVRIVSALRDYWWYQGFHGEGWGWIRRALPFVHDISRSTRANILSVAAKFAFFHHDLTLSFQYGVQALSIYQSLNDKRGIAWNLQYSDPQAINSLPLQIKAITEAIEMVIDISDFPGQTQFLHDLGNLQLYNKDYDQAKSTLEECLEIARHTGETRRELAIINSLTLVALHQGQLPRARKLLLENMILSYKINYLYNLNDMFWWCMAVFFDLGQFDVAFTFYGITVSLEQRTGQHIYYLDGEFLNPYIEKLKIQLNESAAYQELYNKGYKMSSDEAIQFALDELDKD